MGNYPTTASATIPTLQTRQVYLMAAFCLIVGLAIGYLLRGTQSPVAPVQLAANARQASSPGGAGIDARTPSPEEMKPIVNKQAQPTANTAPASPHAGALNGGRMPGPAEMKQMADKQAAPLLEKLKSDPNNSAVLIQVGAIYHMTHQFKEAVVYYNLAVQVDPKNVAARTKLASSLYRTGDVDGAIEQLNRALTYDPKDANALFDLGMIKLQGKQDGKGSLAAWQQLLKSNPQLSADRRAMVEKLMANVLTAMADQHGMEGARSNDGHK